MWTVFEKATGKAIKTGFDSEVAALMWIAAQADKDELDCCPF